MREPIPSSRVFSRMLTHDDGSVEFDDLAGEQAERQYRLHYELPEKDGQKVRVWVTGGRLRVDASAADRPNESAT